MSGPPPQARAPPPSSMPGQQPPQQGSAPPAYFVDTKKGEVSELKQLLKTLAVERDPKRKRDVIKKVIAYMTLGIDVSRLFTEMVMAIETRDLVVKKMVYLYLCNYAHAKPDLALMCVNTLQRDCSADDPMVRGLALRALCSLRLPSMLEYISAPLRRALTDQSPYVRKTGVMGILKLFHLAPEVARAANFVDLLYNMIQDPDPHVVANCLIVLDEVLAAEEGGMAVNQPLILHLLGRLGEFSEWGLTVVLALVAKYRPVDEEELFSIMNLLDPVLRTSNSGVVLSTIKCFLHLTTAVPDLQPQVYVRVKAPLLTLMAGGNPEVEYCILKHLEAMVHRAPGVFDDEYRQLYVRYNEPTFVKYEKIGILALIANDDTVADITSELAEYATDVDQEVSRRSIRAIGNIAFRLPSAAGMVLERLVEFLDIEMNSVRPETILVMKDLLRRYPERKTEVLPSLQRCLRRVDDEPEAQAALIWMAGEYGGEGFPEAPYLLEHLIDGYAGLASAMVKLNLLTATMKLLFKRPPETQSMLGRLLAAATNDLTSQDVHDRALLYYRLLSTDIQAARRVVLGGEEGREEQGRAVVLGAFAEERDMTNLREKLFGEFNTLAVVYGKPSAQFVSPRYVYLFLFIFLPPSRPLSMMNLRRNCSGSLVNTLAVVYGKPSAQSVSPRYICMCVRACMHALSLSLPPFRVCCLIVHSLSPVLSLLFSASLILCLTRLLTFPPSLPPSFPPFLPQLPMQARRNLPYPLPHGRPGRGERKRGQQSPRPERRRQLTPRGRRSGGRAGG